MLSSETIEIKRHIKRLKQGLLTSDREIADQASIRLMGFGDKAAPVVLDELLKIDLQKNISMEAASLISGLVIVLRDLDEDVAESFITDAINQKLNPILHVELERTLRFSINNYRQSNYGNIVLLEERTIDERLNATAYICKWLSKLPKGDLIGISRIYIVNEHLDFEYHGTYTPNIANIAIVWDSSIRTFNPLNWILRFGIKDTLYHEIGHHRFKHTYGQDELQERIANEYSGEQIRRAHPTFRKLVKAINLILGRKAKRKIFWLEAKCSEGEKDFLQSVEVAEHIIIRAVATLIEHYEKEDIDLLEVNLLSEDIHEGSQDLALGILWLSDRKYKN